MKIHLKVKGHRALRGVVVVRQWVFDELQEQGLIEQHGIIFWYEVDNASDIHPLINELMHKTRSKKD